MSDDPRGSGAGDPFDEFRKRMREDPFLGPFFADIDREFDRMRDSLSRMLEDVHSGAMDPSADPFVYGFSLRMGPDGKPHFQEFGNTSARRSDVAPTGLEDAREPLVDIHQDDSTISITVELPGVDKEHVNVRAKEREIVISVDAADRKYYKRINLPAAIETESTKATYKNGVLDIELAKQAGQDEGTPVSID